MRDVDMSAVAVRSARPWGLIAGANVGGMCGIKDGGLVIRTTPELQPAEAGKAKENLHRLLDRHG